MIEGKKISQLNETLSLNDACCFPVLSQGATKKITFAALVNNIIAQLPEISEEELERIRQKLQEHEAEIEQLIVKGESIDEQLSEITFKVNGQDRTILEYTTIVQELQEVYEQATISGGVVDSSLNTDSINPVQNKVLARLIPTQASPENQLADKNFVNSSISTNTAHYISDNGEPFTSLEDLEAYEGTVTQNDYAFITGTDEGGNAYYDRYKADVNGGVVTWGKEYRLNNSSFTAAQWAAISSGITAELVAQIGQGGAGDGTPIGAILPYGGVNAPSGYIICDGRAVSRTDYDKLFEKIGTTFGSGDGSTTFNVPDLREVNIVGAGENTTLDIASHDIYTLGQFKDDQFQAHKHAMELTGEQGNDQQLRNYPLGGKAQGSTYFGDSSHISTPDTSYAQISDTTNGRSGTTTHGKQVAVNFIIKATASTGEVPADVELNDDITTTANVWSASKTNDEIEEVDNKNNYSTTETVVGKWIDGKPIYRKVVAFDSAVNIKSWYNIPNTFINNVDNAIDARARSTTNSTWLSTYTKVSSGLFGVYNSGDEANRIDMIICEYTKTTD